MHVFLTIVDDAHINNAAELAEHFDTIPGGPTFLVEYDSDEEDDCTPLKGIKSSYDFIFSEQVGTIKHRKRPCFCSECLAWKFANCQNKFVAGELQEGKVRYKSAKEDSAEEYEVEEIIDRRSVAHGTEYLVKWSGWSNQYNEWLPEDAIDCPDLLKKFK